MKRLKREWREVGPIKSWRGWVEKYLESAFCQPKSTMKHVYYPAFDINGLLVLRWRERELFWVLDAIFALFLPFTADDDAHSDLERGDWLTDADYASSFHPIRPERRDPLWLHARLKADFSVTMRASVFLPLVVQGYLRKWNYHASCLGDYHRVQRCICLTAFRII